MGKVERFEGLIARQKARKLTKLIYAASGHGGFAKDWGLKDQIRRASVSVMSNVAEGFDRANRAEWHLLKANHRRHSGAGRNPVVSTACWMPDQVRHDEVELMGLQCALVEIYAVAEETGRIVNGLRAAVERQRDEMRG